MHGSRTGFDAAKLSRHGSWLADAASRAGKDLPAIGTSRRLEATGVRRCASHIIAWSQFRDRVEAPRIDPAANVCVGTVSETGTWKCRVWRWRSNGIRHQVEVLADRELAYDPGYFDTALRCSQLSPAKVVRPGRRGTPPATSKWSPTRWGGAVRDGLYFQIGAALNCTRAKTHIRQRCRGRAFSKASLPSSSFTGAPIINATSWRSSTGTRRCDEAIAVQFFARLVNDWS